MAMREAAGRTRPKTAQPGGAAGQASRTVWPSRTTPAAPVRQISVSDRKPVSSDMRSVKGRRWDAPVGALFAPRALPRTLRRAAAHRREGAAIIEP